MNILLINVKTHIVKTLLIIFSFILTIALISLVIGTKIESDRLLDEYFSQNSLYFDVSVEKEFYDGLVKKKTDCDKAFENFPYDIGYYEETRANYMIFPSGGNIEVGSKVVSGSDNYSSLSVINFSNGIPKSYIEQFIRLTGSDNPLLSGRFPENKNEVIVSVETMDNLGVTDYLNKKIKMISTKKMMCDDKGNAIMDSKGNVAFFPDNTCFIDKIIVGTMKPEMSQVFGSNYLVSFGDDDSITASFWQVDYIINRSYYGRNYEEVKKTINYFTNQDIEYSVSLYAKYALDTMGRVIDLVQKIVLLVTALFVPIFFISLFISIDRTFQKKMNYFGMMKSFGYSKKKLTKDVLIEYNSYFLIALAITALTVFLLKNPLLYNTLNSKISFGELLCSLLLGTGITFGIFFLMIGLTTMFYFRKDVLFLLNK